jgi:transposase
MAKYSFEFKKKVVLEYINGEGGTQYLSTKYGLGSNSQLRKWLAAYKEFGDEGLKRSRKKENYSFEKKLSVVELYLSSEISYQDLALQEGITNPSMIVNWVNRFRVAGPDALRPRKKGRKKTLNTSDDNTQNKLVEESSVDTSAEHVKELEEELLKFKNRTFYKILQRETDKRKVGMDESCSIQAPSFSCIKKNETTEVAL